MKPRAWRCALLLAVSSCVALGQLPTSRWSSIKPFPHGYVDRSDLNVHLEFPIFNRSTGTGAQVEGKLVYDSDLWYDNNGDWNPQPGGGWRFQANAGAGTITQYQSAMIPCGSWGATYQLSNYTYHMQDGTAGPAGSYLVVFGGGLHGGEGCPAPQEGSTATAVQVFGQSYTVWTNSGGGVGIWDTQGDNELFDFYDRYYNRVSSSTSNGVTTYSDPLGTSALTVNSNTNPMTYSYTGASGSQISVKETMETVSATANFGCYQEWGGNLTVPYQIEYPDGETYTFTYANGQLASMQLPTGGTVSFPATESCSGGVISGTLSRYESVDGSGAEWHWTSNGTTTTETSPAGDQTVFTFGTAGNVSGALEEVDQYNGTSTEVSKSTIASSAPNGYIASQTITTELLGGSPLYAVRQLNFDAYGNVTSSSTTDWSTSPSGGATLRSTASTWNTPRSTMIMRFRRPARPFMGPRTMSSRKRPGRIPPTERSAR